MTFQLVYVEPKELTQYKSDMQEAFQKGFEDAFGKTDAVILPEKDIDQSVNAEVCAILALWEYGNQKTDTSICYSIILFSYASIERNC